MPIEWTVFVFVLVMGACVGSFINVVIYRLPEGKSIVTPPSACPRCGHGLAWYDNVPVLGWLWLRGRCRYCQNPISIQYPVIEAITSLLFAGLFAAYFFTGLRPVFSSQGLLSQGSFTGTWPVLVVHLYLLGSLIAATMIDARHYIIPLSIPWLVALLAVVLLPVAAALGWLPPLQVSRLGSATTPDALVETAMMLGPWSVGLAWMGVALAAALLWRGTLPRSFADEAEYFKEQEQTTIGELVGHYPHARREMFKELLVVGFPVVGFVAGAMVDLHVWSGSLPQWLLVLVAIGNGALIAAALVWATRILGTLAFGKEAMGLGDVHLMVGIGAVIGPISSVLAFFVAPFMGLLCYAVMMVVGKASKDGGVRMIPYGPFLAGGAVVVMVFRNELLFLLGF